MEFAPGSEADRDHPSLARSVRMDRTARYMSGSAAAVEQGYTPSAVVVLALVDTRSWCRLCWQPFVVRRSLKVGTAGSFVAEVSRKGNNQAGPTHTAAAAAVDIGLLVVSDMKWHWDWELVEATWCTVCCWKVKDWMIDPGNETEHWWDRL